MNRRFAQRTVEFCRELGFEAHLFDLDGHPQYEGITQTVLVCGEIDEVKVKLILDARFANAKFSGEDEDAIPVGVEWIRVPEGVYLI